MRIDVMVYRRALMCIVLHNNTLHSTLNTYWTSGVRPAEPSGSKCTDGAAIVRPQQFNWVVM